MMQGRRAAKLVKYAFFQKLFKPPEYQQARKSKHRESSVSMSDHLTVRVSLILSASVVPRRSQDLQATEMLDLAHAGNNLVQRKMLEAPAQTLASSEMEF